MMLATKARQRSRRCTVIPFFHCGDPFNLPRPCVGVSTAPGVFLKFPPIFVSCPVGRPRGREVGRELLSRKATGKGLIQLSRFSPFLLHLLGRICPGVFPRCGDGVGLWSRKLLSATAGQGFEGGSRFEPTFSWVVPTEGSPRGEPGGGPNPVNLGL